MRKFASYTLSEAEWIGQPWDPPNSLRSKPRAEYKNIENLPVPTKVTVGKHTS